MEDEDGEDDESNSPNRHAGSSGPHIAEIDEGE